MSNKRKYNSDEDDDNNIQNIHISQKRHTLDSDEEDSDDYERGDIGGSDIEGEEGGVSKVQDEINITPFNMREELEEGHFDKEGHFHWDKLNEIKDNWLDNIDWVKIKKEKEPSSDDESGNLTSINNIDVFKELQLYKEILSYMVEGETIGESLQRLGKNRRRMGTAERLKLRKQGIIDENAEVITRITEIANKILMVSGNMDVYQLTYNSIKSKLRSFQGSSKEFHPSSQSFDMYSDDFKEKEQKRICDSIKKSNIKSEVLWEFKWNESDTVTQGPYNTVQMLKWSKSDYFKTGVYVKKVGELTKFYTSNRIDFELYL